MKKTFQRALCLLLCVCMVHSLGILASAESADVSDFADKWVYHEDGDYWALDVVYCDNPTVVGDEPVQHLAIYAPDAYMQKNADGTVTLNANGKVASSTGVVYTATTAPIMLHNTSGGYTSSKLVDPNGVLDDSGYVLKGIDYINEGYVFVSIQTRGKETKDANGKYIGQFPNIMVDLKAGVRFLKYFDDVLPGSSERVISRGYSSGGAVSAMLGASGNSALFDSYLKEIGAYDATDDIFITLASAPITNLSSADASYEWYQHANDTYFLFDSMAYDREGNSIKDIFPTGRNNIYKLGSNILGGAHEDELSDLLYNKYVAYVQGLGFDLGDDGRSGEYYEGFAQIYADALADFIARYDEVKGVLRKAPDTAEEYLASLGEGWFTYDPETGVVTMADLDQIVQNHIQRKKMAPSLDSYNYRSNENDAFRDADGNTVHFSPDVRDALKVLMEDAEGKYNWTEEELAYITALYGDYDAGINEASTYMLEVMSPINYVVGVDGFADATISPYWRLRVGSEDGDHGAPAAWLIAQGLEKYRPDVDVSVGIAWGMAHTPSELIEQDLYDYIAEIMVAEDDLEIMPYTDVPVNAWYLDDLNTNKALGIVDGYEDGTFAPESNMTVAEAVKTAAMIHNLDEDGAITLKIGDDVWYSTYMAYAVEKGIIDADLSDRADELITRAEFVKILYNALPAEKYTAINTVEDGAIPDVEDDESVYTFYRAGIVIGYEDGSFLPENNIMRSEVTAISVRMLNEDARKTVALEKEANGGNTGWGGNSGGWGGNAPSVTAEEIMDGFYVLNESRTRAFLAVGEDKALLIDTMFANDNVLDEVRNITDLPVEVVITHGHPDHIGGIDAFDACYINEADAYFLEGKDITLNYVKDGDKLTAGDFTFEVIETPGHSMGSISLLDRAHKLLISGDEVQAGPIMMFDEEADMVSYAASMQKLLAYANDVETIYAGHNAPVGTEFIQYCYDDATAYLNGELIGSPVTNWDGTSYVDYVGAHVTFRLAE